jgi:negative regulator of flagellin synthesis FlgM
MKVDGPNTNIQIDAYMRQARQQQQAGGTQQNPGTHTAKTDKVEISQTAVETHKATQFLKDSPDVREDRVREIKMEVDSGRYHVPAEKVAGNMLNEGFENDLILKKIDTLA